MKTETCSYEDIVHFFGPLDAHVGKAILDLGPTAAEAEIAAAYVAGMTDVTSQARTPLAGKAALIYDIVNRSEASEDEERRD